MRAYVAFVKKELMEMQRSYKLFILAMLFFLLGVMNPLTAKYTPDLMENFMPEGVILQIPEPAAMDSWQQFFKNVPQMGLIVLAIIFSGLVANEIAKGTLVNVLTKGLKRRTVLLSKFSAATLVWTCMYWFCFLVSWVYTKIFWDTTVPHLAFATGLLWLFGVLIIGIMILGGVLSGSSYGSLLFTGIVVAVLFILNLLPAVKEYNPILLLGGNMELITQMKQPSDYYAAVGIAIALLFICLWSSVLVMEKKRIV